MAEGKKRQALGVAAIPAVAIYGGAELLQYLCSFTSNDLDPTSAYRIVSGMFVAGVYMKNWLTKR